MVIVDKYNESRLHRLIRDNFNALLTQKITCIQVLPVHWGTGLHNQSFKAAAMQIVIQHKLVSSQEVELNNTLNRGVFIFEQDGFHKMDKVTLKFKKHKNIQHAFCTKVM